MSEGKKVEALWKSKKLTKREKQICLYAREVMLTAVEMLKQPHTSEKELVDLIKWTIDHLEGEANVVLLSETQINNLAWLIPQMSGEAEVGK